MKVNYLLLAAAIITFTACDNGGKKESESTEEAATEEVAVNEEATEEEEEEQQRASPHLTIDGQVGDKTVTITYGAPSVKDRVIFGELVKWGEIWRSGADEATTVEFSADVKVAGQDLPAGKYAFFTIPNEEGAWTIIFNKTVEQWGAYKYDETQDALRVEVEPTPLEEPVEQLMYGIENDMLMMKWANMGVMIPVE